MIKGPYPTIVVIKKGVLSFPGGQSAEGAYLPTIKYWANISSPFAESPYVKKEQNEEVERKSYNPGVYDEVYTKAGVDSLGQDLQAELEQLQRDNKDLSDTTDLLNKRITDLEARVLSLEQKK